jgi:hypothetical protein
VRLRRRAGAWVTLTKQHGGKTVELAAYLEAVRGGRVLAIDNGAGLS